MNPAGPRPMRIGVVLPTFAADAVPALEAAAEAEAAGLHGVFAYNHIWPMGHPGRPALSPFPLLGAVAVRTQAIMLGTLVARIGLTPDEVLIDEMLSLDALSAGRFVAAIGTGDAKSATENLAFGVAYPPASERRARVESVVQTLLGVGVATWVGGGADATNAVARATGATLNLWAASPERIAAEAAAGDVSWGGTMPSEPGKASQLFARLAASGASWAVVGWPGSCAPIVEAASTAGVPLG